MNVIIRLDDGVLPGEDVVLRAGGGDPAKLTEGAIANARSYQPLVADGLLRSAYTISVHIARAGIADEATILGLPPYSLYKPYLHAKASELLELGYISIIPTTIVADGETPTPVDLCHFDIVVEATSERELLERITAARALFTKVANPHRRSTIQRGGDTDA